MKKTKTLKIELTKEKKFVSLIFIYAKIARDFFNPSIIYLVKIVLKSATHHTETGEMQQLTDKL